MNYWSQPENVTRTGASHLRRGDVCQDASGRQELTDRSGQPVQILVVADGHGGKRYTQSDVGSHLACKLSLELIAVQFSHWSSTQELDLWRRWLVETFPNCLHQQWLASVEQHWQQQIIQKDAPKQPFSPIPYGTTIGVVIMTPSWWGHTGLGDWDLVRVGSAGDVALVNEEQDESQTSGEATYSLCLSNAPSHFEVRSALYPISQETPNFALLLSTDGVRKSCSTDEDFYAIAKYLCEGDRPRAGETANELKSDLDRISSQGSGDDVSVAIGRWIDNDRTKRKRAVPRRNQQPKQSRPIIVQPRDVNPYRDLRRADQVRIDLRDESSADTTKSKQLGGGRKLLLLIICGLVLASTVGLFSFRFLKVVADNSLGKGGGTSKPTPDLKTVLQQEADALCRLNQQPIPNRVSDERLTRSLNDGNDDTDDQYQSTEERADSRPPLPTGDRRYTDADTTNISNPSNDLLTASLDQRKSIFKDLVNQSKSSKQYLSNPSKDPLSTLIAWDYSERYKEIESESPIKPDIGLCPQLNGAMAVQWEQAVIEYKRSLDQERDDEKNVMLGIDELYKALSIKDFEKARLLYSEQIEDQFNPEFFKQFSGVTARELKTISNQRGVLTIEGEIRFNWSDGTKQIEKRLFIVDTNQPDLIIIGSEFMEIIEPRDHLNGYRGTQ